MKHLFRPVPVVLILFFANAVRAQTKQTGKSEYAPFGLRTSLTSYVDFDAGVMLGVNYRWSENFSASFEPTWIFYNGFITDRTEKIIPSGFRIRSDVKYHFERRRKGSLQFFVAPEFHYKHVKTEREDQFGINCQGGQCAYFQDAIYTEVKNEIGGSVNAGFIAPLGFLSKNDRFFLEVSSGIGAKQLKYRDTDLPVGGSFVFPPQRGFLTFGNTSDRNTGIRPMLPIGIKFIFALR